MTRGEKQKVVHEAAEKLRRKILLGRLRPGESLKGERELSEDLGVSRLTLRAALATLESEGLVHAVHGSGTRVLDFKETGDVALLGHLARYALSGERVEGGLAVFGSLLELRRSVAVDAVGFATERATEEELRAMRTHIGMLAKLSSDPHAFMVADLQFARMIVRATGNLAFELLFNSVVQTVEGNSGIELAFFANAKATLLVYGRLLDRMETRNAERARQTAARLLHRLDRSTIDLLSKFFATQESHESKREAMITRMEQRWASVVLAGFAGAPGAFRVADGEVDYVSAMQRFAGAASEKAQLGLRVAIVLAMTAPLWMWGRLRSLRSFDATERARLLDDMLRHRIFFVRELCLLLKLVACMAIFRAEAPRARTTYDPPAQPRVALVVLRSSGQEAA